METNFFLEPATVSFYGVEFQEEQVPNTATTPAPAAWACDYGKDHLPTPTPAPFVVAQEAGGLGSEVGATDSAYSGYCTYAANGQAIAPTPGYQQFLIPDDYDIGGSATGTESLLPHRRQHSARGHADHVQR